MKKCTCDFCKNHDLYRWAKIMECGCFCHDDTDICGHSSLCCPYPNGKKKDNPYIHLETSEYYKKLLDDEEPNHKI